MTRRIYTHKYQKESKPFKIGSKEVYKKEGQIETEEDPENIKCTTVQITIGCPWSPRQQIKRSKKKVRREV